MTIDVNKLRGSAPTATPPAPPVPLASPPPAADAELLAEVQWLRAELAAKEAKPAEPERKPNGIIKVVNDLALVRGEFEGRPTLGLYPVDSAGNLVAARNGTTYPVKGLGRTVQFWQEHKEAIIALLNEVE